MFRSPRTISLITPWRGFRERHDIWRVPRSVVKLSGVLPRLAVAKVIERQAASAGADLGAAMPQLVKSRLGRRLHEKLVLPTGAVG
jgi:hypothetical protein